MTNFDTRNKESVWIFIPTALWNRQIGVSIWAGVNVIETKEKTKVDGMLSESCCVRYQECYQQKKAWIGHSRTTLQAYFGDFLATSSKADSTSNRGRRLTIHGSNCFKQPSGGEEGRRPHCPSGSPCVYQLTAPKRSPRFRWRCPYDIPAFLWRQ